MKSVEQYKNINHTLKSMKRQIIDSLNYADKVCPPVETPKELWDWLKPKLKFKSDGNYNGQPRELLQTMQCLFKGEIWGRPYMGDCDCFVITTIACLIVNDFKNVKIVLTGRNTKTPVHIYCAVYVNKKRIVLDFTNPNYNQERPYPFMQEVEVPWSKWLI